MRRSGFLAAAAPRITMIINLSEIECARFQKMLDSAMIDGHVEMLGERIINILEIILPTENVRAKVSGHLFAVYLDRNADGERFDQLGPPGRGDA